jgi:hypothetical protein
MAGISQQKAAEYFEYYIIMALQSAGVKVTSDMATELSEAAAAFQTVVTKNLDEQIAALLTDPNSRASKALYRNGGMTHVGRVRG